MQKYLNESDIFEISFNRYKFFKLELYNLTTSKETYRIEGNF